MNLVPVHGSPALFLKEESALIMSDLHYGVEAEMLRSGVWVPNRSTSRTEKILKLIKENKAKKLILLGDVKHQVPHNSKQQRTDLEQFFMAVTRIVDVEIVPGNHDGGLADIAPDNVKFHESVGCTIGNIGLSHGHAWPSQEVMNSEILVMGHEHPAFSFRDRVDKLHSEPCWLRAPMIEHERYEKVPDLLIVMPAFGELAGRTMNREPLKGLGPILRNGLADLSKARVETLEGLEFGELGNLLDLRL
jgi:putative SbcD/Mre11-related phosphoesterase|tara:strand:- start:365 stop:1108 length:744 start_codon:yes stop_codon:yes gene_type:complete